MTTVSDITNRLSDDAKHVSSVFRSVVFDYGSGVIDMLRDGGYYPGTSAKIEIEADLGSAETYTEGQNLPTPIESTYIIASFDYTHFRAVIRENGHERRARGPADQGTRIGDPQRKMERAMFAIRDLMAQTFDGTSDGQIQGLIDSSTNFGGQSRSTYTKLKSYELSASSAAISTALLNKLYTLAQDTPYGAMPDLCLVSATQANKWAELVSGKLAMPDVSSGSLTPTGLMYGSAPVSILPNLTNSVVLLLTGARTGDWEFIWNEANPGRFHVLDLGAANADNPMNLQISTAGAMVCYTPNKQAKLTTLSTG
jgi:hypothetical protein